MDKENIQFNAESGDDYGFDDNAKLANLDVKKKGKERKKKKEKTESSNLKMDIEKNEDMLKRLASKFDDAEEEEAAVDGLNDDESYDDTGHTKPKAATKKNGRTSKPNTLKLKNKLFSEIDPLQSLLPQSTGFADELPPVVEAECV